MGKTTRWFKRLVARIRSDPNPKDKRTLAKSYTNDSHSRRAAGDANLSSSSVPEVPEYAPDDAVKHAIAVAAASAAAAEAALAAAQAAAAVVRLTASGRCYAAPPLHVSLDGARETSAALLIQSQFRGYLARRALRALKGLVKLQAHVRGHITRRKTAETMRSIEAMLRAQARARSLRGYHSPISSDKSSQIYHHGPPTPEKLEMTSYSRITSNTQSPTLSKGSVSRSINRVIIHPDKYGSLNDESIRATRGRRNLHHRLVASCSTEEDKIDTGEQQRQPGFDEEDETGFCTAENSPRFLSAASSRRQSPMTPTKSDTSAASCLSGYSDCPSYMAYTESSRAKVRASSAPRQRPRQQCGGAGSRKRPSIHASSSSAATRACFASKAYAGSGRLHSLGMPIRNNREVYYSGCLN